ncbi:MAG: nucleoside recognition domain-containing protein [Candidatus Saccharibacteria bacterium]
MKNEVCLDADGNIIDQAAVSASSMISAKIDRIVLNRWLGFPLMVLCFGLLFAASFTLGRPVSLWLGSLLDWLALTFEQSKIGLALPQLLMSLISNGILRGIGSALAFFPQMLLFYAFYTLINDTGYAARIANLMHRPMSRLNMDGRSFAPLILGYSCNVTAVVGARCIPSRVDRLIVMLISTFTPCSARFGVILYIAAAFFAPALATVVMCALIVLSWVVSAAVSYVIKKRMPGKPVEEAAIELPPYQLPSAGFVLKASFYKTIDFLNRIKSVVIISSVIVWVLSSFPTGSGFEHSYAAMIGQLLEPVGRVAGLNWQMIVALIFGFFAKETTLSTLGVLFHASHGLGDLGSILVSHISPLAGLAFLVIYMFYIPCLATVTTIRRESQSLAFTGLSILVSLSVAFILGALVYWIGTLIGLIGTWL